MKKAMKLVSLVLAVVMLLGCLTACGSKSATTDATASTDTASNDTAAASDGGEIVIALISNTTGDYAQYGQPVRDGAMLYINQLNANGGINGKQVKVLEYDDKGDGVEAVNAYNLACDNGITAVFGATLTGTTIALADATYEDNMPQVTASATATGVTVIGEKSKRPVYHEDGTIEMREMLDLGLTIDERLADGYYYSKTIRLLKKLLENPELLETPANQEVEY